MIRLIALDFDYTLIDYQEGLKPRIEPEALALLNRLCERGVKAGIVTGRAFDGFAATFADVGGDWRAPFPAYMIASDSFIYQKDAKGDFYADEAGNDAARARIRTGVQALLPHVQPCLKRLEESGVPVKGWSVDSAHGLTVETDAPESAARAIALSEGLFPGGQLSRNYHLFHVTPEGEGKGMTVLRYARSLGYRPEETLCIGDSLNDLTMLDGRFGFYSGTVANGAPEVRAAVLKSGGIVSERRASLGAADCIMQTLERLEQTIA